MTSCTATAPIDLTTNGSVNPISGTFICVYDPDMCSSASVTASDDLSHLSINCGGGSKSNISFYGKTYAPSEIRIYAPSLHTYNGSRADAEIMIVHMPGSGSGTTDGLIVSVPVTMGGGSSSNSDLAAIIQAANTINPKAISLQPSAPINYDVNVNNFIPAKPYYVYYGTLPYDSCGGNYYYAAFTDPISGSGSLSAILVDSGIATVQPSMKTNLQKSKSGPTTGVGSQASVDEYVLYEVAGGEDCDDDAAEADSNNDAANSASAIRSQTMGINFLWGIAIAAIILFVWYMFWRSDAVAAVVAAVAPAVVAPAASAPPIDA